MDYPHDAVVAQQLVGNRPFLRIHAILFINDHTNQQEGPQGFRNQKQNGIKSHYTCWWQLKFVKRDIELSGIVHYVIHS